MKHLKEFIPVEHQYNPFSLFQDELNRVFRNFSRWLEPTLPAQQVAQFRNLNIIPAMDFTDEHDYFQIKFEIPGIEKEDLKISISNNLLTIRGEKTLSKKNEDKNYMTSEINYGSYERRINLPDSADIDKAKAFFKNGMLVIDVPKKPGNIKACRVLEIEGS